jgi:hypothetical protein
MNHAPILLADLVPTTVAEMGARAARPDFDRWADQAKSCGHCSRPIRVRGRSTTHTQGGRLVEAYDTRGEPDGVAYLRCGNRRAAVCPSCSHEYQGDMWHLLYAGTAGGIKDVPDTIAGHPLDFLTLTAPSFGRVHTTRGPGRPCHPRGRRPTFCPHGRPEHCPRVHTDDDPDLGAPLCGDCYDYGGQVAFNWHAPELWRRFTITLRRRLADLLGIPRSQLGEQLVVSFAKVAEFQRRGLVHFHALIRLDGPGENYPPPAIPVNVDQLTEAIRAAAGETNLITEPYTPGGPVWELRFGGQLDIRPVHGQAQRDASTGPMHPEMVAAYIAKYATKAAEDFGLTPQRIHPDTDLARLPVSDHIRRHLAEAVKIAAAAEVAHADSWRPLARWLHMLGFRGHFATKSRRYSITLGRLRAERRSWRRRHDPNRWPDQDDGDLDDTTLVITRYWTFQGVGWLTTGDAALAASAAARAREHRDHARDHRTTHTDQDHG